MKKKELLKRIEVLEAIINQTNGKIVPYLFSIGGTNERLGKIGETIIMDENPKNGWYKYRDVGYLMYHDFVKNTKYGFNSSSKWVNPIALELTKGYTKADTKEVEQRLKEEAVKRGFKTGATINNSILGFENINYLINSDTFQYYETEIGVGGFKIMKNGVWAEMVEESKEPKVGDIGIFLDLDNDKSAYIIQQLTNITDKPYKYISKAGGCWKNFEPLPKELQEQLKPYFE